MVRKGYRLERGKTLKLGKTFEEIDVIKAANGKPLVMGLWPMLLACFPLVCHAAPVGPSTFFMLGLVFLVGAQAIIFLALVVLIALVSTKPCRRRYVKTTLWATPLIALASDGVLLGMFLEGIHRDEYILFQAFIAQVIGALAVVIYSYFACRRQRDRPTPPLLATSLSDETAPPSSNSNSQE